MNRVNTALERAARRAQGSSDIGSPAKVYKTYTALTVPPGRVRLDLLDDPDWASQLKAFLRAYGRFRSNDFTKKASEITFKNRQDTLRMTFMELRKARNLKTLSQLKPKLLPAMIELWEARGVEARARINYFNVMRWFWRICGIEIPSIDTYAKYPGEYRINRNAEVDKSWSGNGVDVDAVMASIRQIDPVAERLVVAMFTYGLRLKESLRLQPHESDQGKALAITKGTKTGRPRQLEFMEFEDEADYRRILDDLKSQVGPEEHLAWQNRSLAQARQRMYYIARQVGITRKGLGVTWHGLRHEWAIRQLENLTGQKAPVRGGIAIDYHALSDARRKVSAGLGHVRINITNAYYGSFLSLEREQAKRFDASWRLIEPAICSAAELLQGQGLDNLYWIGSRALGTNAAGDPYEFVLPPGSDPARAVSLASTLAAHLSAGAQLECNVHIWEAMAPEKQVLWEAEAVPLFSAVAPKDLMLHRLQVQKLARTHKALRSSAQPEGAQQPDLLAPQALAN